MNIPRTYLGTYCWTNMIAVDLQPFLNLEWNTNSHLCDWFWFYNQIAWLCMQFLDWKVFFSTPSAKREIEINILQEQLSW